MELPVQEVSGIFLVLAFPCRPGPLTHQTANGGTPHTSPSRRKATQRRQKWRCQGEHAQIYKTQRLQCYIWENTQTQNGWSPTRARPRLPEVPTHATTWMDPEDIAPSDKHCATALMPGTLSTEPQRQDVGRRPPGRREEQWGVSLQWDSLRFAR